MAFSILEGLPNAHPGQLQFHPQLLTAVADHFSDLVDIAVLVTMVVLW